MKCPHCSVNLLIAEKQGVEIDYCPDCRGVWLDRGELEKIIERSTQSHGDYSRKQPHYEERHYEKSHKYDNDDNYYGNDQYKHNKKRSFLSEIFDFG